MTTEQATERSVMVGDHRTKVNEAEWLVATAEPGTLLRVTKRKKTGALDFSRNPDGTFDMVLKGSYWYDGIVGYGWDPATDRTQDSDRTCFPALGDEVAIIGLPSGGE